MKHPKHEVLQDYFECVLNPYQEKLVKEHLLDCDQCTKILSHFTMIETRLKNQKPIIVSEQIKARIFQDAQKLLALKKLALTKKTDLRNQRKEKLESYVDDWKETIFPQIRIPALQLASLSLVLVVLVAVEMGPNSSDETSDVVSDQVQEFTFSDNTSEEKE